jgi:phosphatidate cytidylyltransferase
MNETLKRILVTIVFLPILAFTLVNGAYNALGFAILITIIGFLGYFELKRLFSKKQFRHSFLIPLGIFLIYLYSYLGNYHGIVKVFLIIFLLETFIQMFIESNYYDSFVNIISGLFVLFYIGLLFGCGIIVRQFGGSSNNIGVSHYIIIVTGTWMCDIGAYFIGKFLGFHKLHLAVSPNKSLEGFIGGVIFSFIGIKVACAMTGIAFSYAMLFLPFATIIGDLLESLIKRMAGEKDSGGLIPGHGGILDVFDALIMTTPLYLALIML